MTYCQDYQKLFQNVSLYLLDKGYFIFTHRVDLWEKFDFDNVIKETINFDYYINQDLLIIFLKTKTLHQR